MNKAQFQQYWVENFPNIPMINNLFKHYLKGRWLRIHSLPEAKRYAETEEEWAVLLERQNTLFVDLMPKNKKICIVSGIYRNESIVFEKHIFDALPYHKTLDFKELDSLDLFKLSGDWHDDGLMFTPTFAEEIYAPNKFDSILKSIANDEWRLFFLDPKSHTIIAPYDGGVDIIFGNEGPLSIFSEKYKNWLSKREDGL
jgi:hypothetical protein